MYSKGLFIKDACAHKSCLYAHIHTCVHMLHKIDNETEGGILFGLYTQMKRKTETNRYDDDPFKSVFVNAKKLFDIYIFFFFQFAGAGLCRAHGSLRIIQQQKIQKCNNFL